MWLRVSWDVSFTIECLGRERGGRLMDVVGSWG